LVCLNIASKFDALDLNIPFISELQRASGTSIPYNLLKEYERECLKILGWNLKLVTIYHFIDVIKQQGFIFTNDTRDHGESIEDDLCQILEKGRVLIDYFCSLVINDDHFLRYKPSITSAAIVLVTRVCLNIDKPWSDTLSEMLVYDKDDIYQAYLAIEERYGYLIEVAESICVSMNNSDLNVSTIGDRMNRLDLYNGQSNSTTKKKLEKRMEVLNNLHDYTDRFQVQPKFITSDDSQEDSNHHNQIELSDNEDEYLYYEENGLSIPYKLNAADLSYIEHALQKQALNGENSSLQIRSASIGSQGFDDYKGKISSLLGANTKGSTSGKENENESPFFDSD